MAYDYRTDQWQQSRSIKEHFSLRSYQGRHPELLSALISYVDTLANTAIAFADIRHPGHSDAFHSFAASPGRGEVVKVGVKLHRLGRLAPFLPLLIAARLRHPSDASAGCRYLASTPSSCSSRSGSACRPPS